MDVQCPFPPPIPTNEEYVLKKDDGYVYIQYYEYPLPTAAIKKNLTSEFNYTSLSRNYNSNLT